MEQKTNPVQRVAIIGASRGLGAALGAHLNQLHPETEILAVARRSGSCPGEWLRADVSQEEGQLQVLRALDRFRPQVVVCTVGGGPYGAFATKGWRDHQWSLQVTLLFPARLIHWALTTGLPTQVVLVGSAVAEAQADPQAASYCAGKHGLMGLIKTLREERAALDIRLYSPGYMDTDLLPPNASVRQRPLWKPKEVAEDLLKWMAEGPAFDHRRLAVFPSDR